MPAATASCTAVCDIAPSRQSAICGEGEQRGYGQEGKQYQEHRTPGKPLREERGSVRSRYRGYNIRGGYCGEHSGAQGVRVAEVHARVRAVGQRPSAKSLQRAAYDKHLHPLRCRSNDQPSPKERVGYRERHRQPSPVDLAPRPYRADELRQQVGATDPDIQRQAAERVRDHGGNGRECESLERDYRDDDHDAQRQSAVLPVQDAPMRVVQNPLLLRLHSSSGQTKRTPLPGAPSPRLQASWLLSRQL